MSINTQKIRIYFAGLFALWTILAAGYSVSQYVEMRSGITELAKKEANIAFLKDTLYRKWASSHGGVYVPVSGDSPPNPYLAHVQNRDIKSPDGTQLTLVNPAYMTRQVYDMAGGNVVQGHLTSDKLLNPINKPDKWETKALDAIYSGVSVFSEVSEIKGEPFLRFMKPFMTEEGCLKCHAQQGYQIGDIRGGISLAVPLKNYYDTFSGELYRNTAVNITAWFFGIFILWFSYTRLTALMVKEEKLNREKDDILRELNHRVKNNLQIISSIIDIHKSRDAYASDEFLDDIQGRLVSMSAMHSMFVNEKGYIGVDSGEYLKQLVDYFESSYSGKILNNVKIILDADSVVLSGTQAVSCGLIINELLTNSYKYAFNGGHENPEVRVSFKADGDKAVLGYSDNGSGFVYDEVSEKQDSYGFLLIGSMAAKLGAEMNISGEGGMKADFSFVIV